MQKDSSPAFCKWSEIRQVPIGVVFLTCKNSFTCSTERVQPYASHGATKADDAKKKET